MALLLVISVRRSGVEVSFLDIVEAAGAVENAPAFSTGSTGDFLAAKVFAAVLEGVLAFTSFPREHWRQIWSNNPEERLDKEIRRRTDVVGLFPNRADIVRRVGALLAEQSVEWAMGGRYFSLESIAHRNTELTTAPAGRLSSRPRPVARHAPKPSPSTS